MFIEPIKNWRDYLDYPELSEDDGEPPEGPPEEECVSQEKCPWLLISKRCGNPNLSFMGTCPKEV